MDPDDRRGSGASAYLNSKPDTYPGSRPEAQMITASQLLGATPVGGYSWRPPSPPHIHVPQNADDQELVLPAYNGNEFGQEDREILKHITQHQDVAFGTRDWKYEMRRKAQAIQPFLYLGPAISIRDLDFLRSEQITLLLGIRNTASAAASLVSGDKIANQLGIQSTAVDVSGNQELIATFPRIFNLINTHLINNFRQSLDLNKVDPSSPLRYGKVLVFCESGNERSAAAIAAYLMHMYGLDLITAIQYLQSQRFCVALDDTLKNLLRNYDELLNAQRSVSAAAAQGQAPSPTRKRAREEETSDEDDGDISMSLTGQVRLDDLERFGNRAGFAPFHETS